MERDPRAFLWDARHAADLIADFTEGLNAETYEVNDLIRAAVERQFEIIGEALNQLARTAPDIAKRVPNLSEIVSFRNVLIHGYATINHPRVWEIVATKLPGLREVANALLVELGPPEA